MNRKAAVGLVLGGSLWSTAFAADADDDRFYLLPMYSRVQADDARGTGDADGGVLAAGTRLGPQSEVEIFATQLEYGGSGATQKVTGGGIGYNFFLFPSGTGLFVHGDVAGLDRTLFDLGLGFDLGVFRSGWALRLEALAHTESGFEFHETQLNAGLRIPLGAQRLPPPAPEPVHVVPPPLAVCADGKDNDDDGRIDFPADAGCSSAVDSDENGPSCALPESGQALTLDGCRGGDTLLLRGVNFEFDKATLTAEASHILDGVAAALIARPDLEHVEIAGHTDDRGAESYNQRLSQQRAEAVAGYLGARGVAPSRLLAKGYGELQPVASNADDAGREQNRRVELRVLVAETPAPAPASVPQATPAPPVPIASQPSPPPPQPKIPPAAAAGANTVVISGYQFQPETLAVARGASVTWKNQDSVTHTVKFPDGDFSVAASGSYSRRFDSVGDFAYACGIHSSMKGKVVVTEY